MKRQVLIIFLLLFILNTCYATDRYIATDGNDTTGDGLEGNPWATLQKAHDNISAGETIHVRGGTYTGDHSVIWTVSGSSGSPITVQAYTGESPIFTDSTLDTTTFFNIRAADWVILDGIEVDGYFLGVWTGYWIDSEDHATNIIVRNCYFHDGSSYGIYNSWGTENITIHNNKFEDPGGHPLGPYESTDDKHGIQFWHGQNVLGAEIYNNIFIDCYYGIICADNATDVNIYNNTFYYCLVGLRVMFGAGEGPSGGVTRYTAKNNIFHVPNTHHLGVIDPRAIWADDSLTDITTDYNVLYRASGDVVNWNGTHYTLAEYVTNTTNGDNSISSDPLFVSDGSDYHLQSTSLAINAGTATGAPSTDYDQNPRPQGASFDIGAYEFLSNSTSFFSSFSGNYQ